MSKSGTQTECLARFTDFTDLIPKCFIQFSTFSQFNFCPITWNYCCRGDILKLNECNIHVGP